MVNMFMNQMVPLFNTGDKFSDWVILDLTEKSVK